MTNLQVKYNNKMNLLAFKDLDKVEANLFFSLIARLKEKGTESVVFDFSELTEFLDKNLTTKEIFDLLNKGIGKIVQTALRWEVIDDEGHKIIFFTLFNEFVINTTRKTLKASISPKFLYILNSFDSGNFTMFELAEFSSLASKYTQTIYRLLKQYKNTGFLKIDWNDFIEIMDIPPTYRMFDIERRILKPAIAELTQEADLFNQNNPIFKSLIYKKIRGKGRGRPVIAIEFYFTPRNATKSQKKSLETIARDIQVKEALKQIKGNTEPKQQEPKQINPLTGKESDWSQEFIGRHIKVKNKFDGGYDTCKIENIQEVEGRGYVVGIRNQENNTTFIKALDNKEHFLNWFKKSLGA